MDSRFKVSWMNRGKDRAGGNGAPPYGNIWKEWSQCDGALMKQECKKVLTRSHAFFALSVR